MTSYSASDLVTNAPLMPSAGFLRIDDGLASAMKNDLSDKVMKLTHDIFLTLLII